MGGKFPAQQGHPTTHREGKQQRLGGDGQDQPGGSWLLGQLCGLLEVEATEHLGADDLDSPIRLDQQATIRVESCKGLLPLELGVGANRRGPLGHQGVTPLHQAGAPGRRKALAQRLQLGHQGAEQQCPVVEQLAQLALLGGQVVRFLAQACLLQPGEAPQGHGQHRIGLALAQIELHLQARPGTGGITGSGDQGDHPLQGVEGFDQTLDNFESILTALEGVAGAPDQGEFAVFEEFLQQAPQAQLYRLAIDEGQQNCPKIALQGGAALEVGQHGFGIGVPPQLHHHPHAIPVALVADVGNAADLAFVHLLCQFLDPARLAQLVGQLGDHHGAAAVPALAGLDFLDVGHPPHRDAAPAQQVGVAQALAHQHLAAGGEIRARYQLQQLFVAEIRVAHQGDQGIHHLAQVVGRDVGGHAYGDAGAAIEEQEGQLGGQNRWFLLGAVEVGGKVNGFAADFIEEPLIGDRGQAGFRVAHRRRRIVVDGAEVAVAIQQWMAAGEGLHLAHQGVVDGLVAVGVVFAQHVTDHPGALAVGAIGGEAQLMHREENPPLHWLEPVPHIRQGPPHDHAHRVLEVGALHLLMQGDRLDARIVARIPTRIVIRSAGFP